MSDKDEGCAGGLLLFGVLLVCGFIFYGVVADLSLTRAAVTCLTLGEKERAAQILKIPMHTFGMPSVRKEFDALRCEGVRP